MSRQPSFGRRLRAQRVRRGMSQGDLAGGTLSASTISLLESGRREPSTTVIETLAGRLGCAVSYLADGEGPLRADEGALLVLRGEFALSDSDPQLAAKFFDEALVSGPLESWLTVRARLGLAAAAEALQQFDQALGTLTRLAGTFRAQADRVPLAVSIALARSQRAAGQPGQSIATARDALSWAVTLGLNGLDEYVQLATVIVGGTADGGDFAAAAAEATMLLDQIGTARGEQPWRAYQRASELAQAKGAGLDALYLADRAEAARRASDGLGSPSALRMSLAWLLRQQSDADDELAEQQLRMAYPELERMGDTTTLVCCEIQLAQVTLARGHCDEGSRWARAALDRARSDEGTTPELVAALMVFGECQLACGDRATAASSYRQAADLLSGIGDAEQAQSSWAELGRLLHEAGEPDAALHAYNRALQAKAG